MLLKIKNRLDKELIRYALSLDEKYSLRKISPLLARSIKEFILREGKRLRPILFILGYLGFRPKAPYGLYKSAISIELLHDFLLIHDDIIDRSALRRGKPALHKLLDKHLGGIKRAKFNGADLGIMAADALCAMAIDTFLGIRVRPRYKENALRYLLEAIVFSAGGEFAELLYGLKKPAEISREDIYKVYDLKTANYSFAAPLAMGAALAGQEADEIKILSDYGIRVGRAFQIRDDILGMFASEGQTGKDSLTDLSEAKKTLLIWRAYRNSPDLSKSLIRRILSREKIQRTDILRMREVIISSGSLDYARRQISLLLAEAEEILSRSAIDTRYKTLLAGYCRRLTSS
jgi:geranylgeranyl diphosphate synthase type I